MNITLVIDASGSMQSIKDDAQGGINKLFEKFPDDKFTIVEFGKSEGAVVVCEGKKGKKCKYTLDPTSGTDLFDAVGKAVSMLDFLEDNYFVLVSDGDENSSKIYNKEVFDDLTKLLEKNEVEFEFIGLSGFDAVNSRIAHGSHYVMNASRSFKDTDAAFAANVISASHFKVSREQNSRASKSRRKK